MIVRTHKRVELVDITEMVKERVAKTKITGICSIYVPHATAAIIINEFEPYLEKDFETIFGRILPSENYLHNTIDDNAQAHLLSALFGCEKRVPVKEGKLLLGTWQRIILCDFDGPRERKVIITLTPGEVL